MEKRRQCDQTGWQGRRGKESGWPTYTKSGWLHLKAHPYNGELTKVQDSKKSGGYHDIHRNRIHPLFDRRNCNGSDRNESRRKEIYRTDEKALHAVNPYLLGISAGFVDTPVSSQVKEKDLMVL
jgi:hypothetical protein